MEAVLNLFDICKNFGRKKIISNFSMTIKKGQIVGLVGPNGAGKSTLIKIMVGLLKPSRGQVYINGISLKRDYEKAISNVGCIVENPEFFPDMSGYENLDYFAGFRKNISKEDIDEIADKVGLQNRIHDKVKNYSLGMKQRLGIALALLGNPRILITDEPFNSLDATSVYEIRQLVKMLAKDKNLTMIISSHNLNEIQSLCTDVVFIKEGRLVLQKEMKDIVNAVYYRITVPEEFIEKALYLLRDYKAVRTDNSIQIKASGDNLNGMLYILLENNIPILEIKNFAQNLEEIYLLNTGGDFHVR
ncbi:MAG TPA: ABC transporter ATP-binding protein [Acholeplasmataceae bacterium]|nr:ABC transporter ATP-binding protein [Acholeplasmataceae bacterium]